MRARPDGDAGAAAVELALVLPLLLGILTLVVPLALMLQAQAALGEVAGETVRFGTSRTGEARTAGGTTVVRGALPTTAQAQAEGQDAFRERAVLPVSAVTVNVTRDRSTVCPTTWSRTVRLDADLILGPAALLLGGSTTKTLRASATSCEE